MILRNFSFLFFFKLNFKDIIIINLVKVNVNVLIGVLLRNFICLEVIYKVLHSYTDLNKCLFSQLKHTLIIIFSTSVYMLKFLTGIFNFQAIIYLIYDNNNF